MTKATIDQDHQTFTAQEIETLWKEVEKQNNLLSKLRPYLAVGKWVFIVMAIPMVIFVGSLLVGEQPPFGIASALSHTEIRIFQFSAILSVFVGLIFFLVFGFLFGFDAFKNVLEERVAIVTWVALLTDRISNLESQHTDK